MIMSGAVYADFNNTDVSGRIRLNSVGTTEDVEKLSSRLTEGKTLEISDGEMRANGVVEFSSEENIWVIRIDEDTVQDC